MDYGDFKGREEELVEATLEEVERAQDVRILMACELGSRAWGYDIEGSDLDVRFVYVRPPSSYLSVRPGRAEAINWVVDDTLDVCGWDLARVLRLVHASNTTVFDLMSSPVRYRTSGAWQSLVPIASSFFSPRAACAGYVGNLRQHSRVVLAADLVSAKAYLHMLRLCLACSFVSLYHEPAPARLAELADALARPECKALCMDLIACRSALGDCDRIAHIEAIDALVRDTISAHERCQKGSDEPERPWDALDAAFCRIVLGC